MSKKLQGSVGVRLSEPRVPSDPDTYVKMARAAGREVQVDDVLNVSATMAQHPKLSDAWSRFAGHVLQGNSLPPRDRELVILRIGWLCQAAYEWSHHSLLGLDVGLTQDEILRVTKSADAEGWSDFDRALIRATDELHEDSFVSDATWAQLAARYSRHQMMDLVFTVGQYNLVSMALNSFGVQLDKDRQGFPQ